MIFPILKTLSLGIFIFLTNTSLAVDLNCEPNDTKCEKEEYKITIYKQGRDEYEKARQSGDFTKVYHIARELAGLKDRKGRMMLKMVHIQLGWGKHKDYPQAYAWLDQAIKDGLDYAPKWLERLQAQMSASQLKKAKVLAEKNK